jgi:Protein of unknown function (DUF1573)
VEKVSESPFANELATVGTLAGEPMVRAWSNRGFTATRVVLGLILLVAAVLKLFSLGDDSGFVGRIALFTDPLWQTAAIEMEAVLGLWLLTGLFPRLLWLAALIAFVILAGVSLYLGIERQPSCGCFGAKLTVSPWYALGLDLAALVSLVWWRPRQRQRAIAPNSATLRYVFAATVGAGVILALGVGGLTWMYGSPYEVLLRVRGEAITVEPGVTEVGDGAAGEKRTFTIQLSNHRDLPVNIYGGTTSCSCITTDDLPIIVPPKESRTIAVRMKFRGDPGRFQHSLVLYIDDKKQSTAAAWFTGRVIEPPSP